MADKDNDHPKARLEFYREGNGDWRWRVTSTNGSIVGVSSEGYRNRAEAEQGSALTAQAIIMSAVGTYNDNAKLAASVFREFVQITGPVMDFLRELGIISSDNTLTQMGRDLAKTKNSNEFAAILSQNATEEE